MSGVPRGWFGARAPPGPDVAIEPAHLQRTPIAGPDRVLDDRSEVPLLKFVDRGGRSTSWRRDGVLEDRRVLAGLHRVFHRTKDGLMDENCCDRAAAHTASTMASISKKIYAGPEPDIDVDMSTWELSFFDINVLAQRVERALAPLYIGLCE